MFLLQTQTNTPRENRSLVPQPNRAGEKCACQAKSTDGKRTTILLDLNLLFVIFEDTLSYATSDVQSDSTVPTRALWQRRLGTVSRRQRHPTIQLQTPCKSNRPRLAFQCLQPSPHLIQHSLRIFVFLLCHRLLRDRRRLHRRNPDLAHLIP